MKIAVSSTGPSLNDQIDARFGRCVYFIIVDPATMDFEAIPNQNVSSTSGAGISSAQLMVDKGADVVLTGNLGPKAANVFDASNTKVVTNMSGPVGEVVQRYASGETPPQQASPNQTQAAGNMSPGMGGGRGMGGGGGQGMGGGRGMGGGCRQTGGSGGGMGRGRGMGGGRGMRNN